VKSKHKVNVLLVFANPLRTHQLRLDTEAREIKQALERSQYRDNIAIETLTATTIRDLRRALLAETYQIIHISGHGSNTGLLYGGTVCQDSFWAKRRQNPTVQETRSYLLRYTCAGV
jgi:hypothetical protein